MMQLITVKNQNGKSATVRLDSDAELLTVRGELISRGIMSDSDYFLYNDSPLAISDEADTALSELIDSAGTIYVGKGIKPGILPDEDMEDYRDLNESQKEDLFRKCQIFRGLVFSRDKGIAKSFKDLYSWTSLPAMLTPRVNTQELSDYSFSKITQDINLITSNKANLALDVPYVSAQAEYSHEKSIQTSSSKVKEYLLAKYLVLKASFELDVSALTPNPEFVKAVNEVIISHESDKDKMCNLLHVLGAWGLYIPQRFTLGGALYSTEVTEIDDFSQSESEKAEFSSQVKAELAFGSGSAGGSCSKEEKTETGTSAKYTNIVINQIGGTPGQTKDKEGIAISLKKARYWETVDVEMFYPSLMLLNNANVPGTDPRLLAKCLQLMNNNYHYGAVKEIQPYVNMLNYATTIENLINPF